MEANTKKVVFDWVRTIALVAVFSFAFRGFVAEARFIPSESMEPTLHVGDKLYVEKITYKVGDIERGDIVVFEAPEASQHKEDMIKRVIALPGETVEIRGGIVYVNGQALDEPYEAEKPASDFPKMVVPENNLFVMGDNRNNSLDSRFWGTLPIENVIGKAFVRYYPFNQIGVLQ